MRALIALATLLPALALADGKRDGKWEVTTKVDMPGMNLPPQTHVSCLSKKNQVPFDAKGAKNCQVKDLKTSGSTTSWKMTCQSEQGGSADGDGEVTYGDGTFEGTMHLTMTMGEGRQMKMTNHLTGKRLGDCDRK